ncbi:hypothetical protein BU26DRAFT_506043 [Trematosphaeria pertusa]|uniref:Uncharacterized protein n=1 Tax=Trematosphaeria pertusa TaxID=390896 RepID=A0A6A6IFL9_9PLEO|nr:uncharacterized protein BU26DRAFT_506043 [Trematosphaeria pertusa]KAF2248320.1 hypothetical protein BU26DRAFT_506043 [Trematosphaeria pertusa]
MFTVLARLSSRLVVRDSVIGAIPAGACTAALEATLKVAESIRLNLQHILINGLFPISYNLHSRAAQDHSLAILPALSNGTQAPTKMSNPSTSNALVPSSQGSSAFSQQGSLDWVALGKMQYSASIAVLSRLAKAGIDTLTVAFGQAMCVRLPIGAHGEKILAESMKTLTAKSVAGDLIWFGVGVRHILRELVQTSQGCSLVALCAALTESHSISVSALVLYEIARECGGSQELAPSLEQWEALVRVASPVFNATTFGIRIHQISRLGMPVNGLASRPEVSHPSDLAKALLSIGQIVHGSLRSVSIHGGYSSSWIAAWADFVLGLRVLVRDTHGIPVYANYDTSESFAQVNIDFFEDGDNKALVCVESSHIVRSGREFIRQCFGPQRRVDSMDSDVTFCAGRLHWETMLSDTFGDAFTSLMQRTDDETSIAPPPAMAKFRFIFIAEQPMTRNQIFTRMLAISAIVFVAKGVTTMHYGTARHYLLRACDTIPELRQCKEEVLLAVRDLSTAAKIEDSWLDHRTTLNHLPKILGLTRDYELLVAHLQNLCPCDNHEGHSRQFCLLRLADTIIYMTFLFDCAVLDTPLKPTVYGLHYLYDGAVSIANATAGMFESRTAFRIDAPPSLALFTCLSRFAEGDCAKTFAPLAAVFSAEDWKKDSHGDIAQSDGKLYCYIQPLEELTDNIQTASKIHVGSGPIEYRARNYPALHDKIWEDESRPLYPTRRTELVDDISYLKHDTTINPITVQLVIEEKPPTLGWRRAGKRPRGIRQAQSYAAAAEGERSGEMRSNRDNGGSDGPGEDR